MTTIRQQDFIAERRRRAAVHLVLPPAVDYIEALGEAYRAEESPAAQGRDRADPHQLADVRRGPSADLPGHRHRRRVREGRHGRARGTARRCRSPTWSTRACAAPTSIPTTRCARRSSPTRRARARTRSDNTPAVVHFDLVPGDTVEVKIAAKGGGSENKSKFVMLNPSDSIVDWVLKTVPTMGAGWCPPGMLGIGIGGTAEKAMLLAKEALMEPIDMHELCAARAREPTRGAAHRALRQGATRSASARRAWADCRRCSTSRSSTTRRTRRRSRSA